LTAAAALPGIGLHAGTRVDAAATVAITPDGAPRSLTVTTVAAGAPGREPSLEGDSHWDGGRSDAEVHTYVTEVVLDLSAPAVQAAVAEAGGGHVDGLAAALVATLSGAVYDRAVLGAAQVTVTEWAAPTVKGLDAACGVAELAEVSGGLRATSTHEEAVARHLKPAGAAAFSAAPLGVEADT
jgi:hypothetical protein